MRRSAFPGHTENSLLHSPTSAGRFIQRASIPYAPASLTYVKATIIEQRTLPAYRQLAIVSRSGDSAVGSLAEAHSSSDAVHQTGHRVSASATNSSEIAEALVADVPFHGDPVINGMNAMSVHAYRIHAAHTLPIMPTPLLDVTSSASSWHGATMIKLKGLQRLLIRPSHILHSRFRWHPGHAISHLPCPRTPSSGSSMTITSAPKPLAGSVPL